MRLALLTAFVLTVLPAISNGQSHRMDISSLQAGARTSVLEPMAGSRFRYGVDPRFAIKSLAWQQFDKADESAGSHRHTGRGLVVGLVVGAIAGVAYGRSSNPGEMGRGYNEAVGAVAVGAIGAVCGAIIGYAWRSDN